MDDRLRQAFREALNASRRDETTPLDHRRHDQHRYDASCNVCRGDADAMVVSLLAAPELVRLVRALAEYEGTHLSACMTAEDALAATLTDAGAAIARVRKLHQPYAVYEDCGHDGPDDHGGDVVCLDDGRWVCRTGYLLSVCGHCCVQDEAQSDRCAGDHDHEHGWACDTILALDGPAADETGGQETPMSPHDRGEALPHDRRDLHPHQDQHPANTTTPAGSFGSPSRAGAREGERHV